MCGPGRPFRPGGRRRCATIVRHSSGSPRLGAPGAPALATASQLHLAGYGSADHLPVFCSPPPTPPRLELSERSCSTAPSAIAPTV